MDRYSVVYRNGDVEVAIVSGLTETDAQTFIESQRESIKHLYVMIPNDEESD